jgi:hypothetical protein
VRGQQDVKIIRVEMKLKDRESLGIEVRSILRTN